jgi:cell division protein FtsI/penicillin-binding protein 2
MQSKFVGVFPILAALLAASMFLTVAQSQAKEPKESKNITVTGCLEQGAAADQFNITDENGKKYAVTSGRVPLKNHVGHKVSLNGVKRGEEAGTTIVRVMGLKMVGKTCQ